MDRVSYLELEPATARSKDPTELWDDPEWIAEEKLDGWRFLMHFGRDLDRPYLTGRRVSSTTGRMSEKGLCVPCLWPDQRVTKFFDYTVLDGEIVPPVGRDFRDLAGILNVDPDDALRRVHQIGAPRYRVFDVLFFHGRDVREWSMIERKHLLVEDLLPQINRIYEHVQGRTDSRAHYDEILARGGEGVILKRIDACYGESGGWIKVKRSSTLDVVVTGFKPGKGKYAEQVGALLVSVRSSRGELLEIGAVSGMDDETRLHMSSHWSEWLGSVVEIEAQEWAKDRLRHPRFVRRRDDVSSETCTLARMFEILRSERPVEAQGSLGI